MLLDFFGREHTGSGSRIRVCNDDGSNERWMDGAEWLRSWEFPAEITAGLRALAMVDLERIRAGSQ
jgi:hypothetical protein